MQDTGDKLAVQVQQEQVTEATLYDTVAALTSDETFLREELKRPAGAMSGEPGSSSSSQVLPARSKQHHDFGVHLDERVHQSQHHFFVVRKGCDNTTFIQNFAGPWRDWSGRLLVIDEVSTCGAAAFEIVSRRIQQMARVLWRRHFATPPPEEMAPFGGIGVVLMGHFAQLPHPSRPACFRTCHGAPNNL